MTATSEQKTAAPWMLPKPARGTDAHRAWLIACYVEEARRIGCAPHDVGRMRLAGCAEGTEVSWPGERDVKAIGGASRLKALLVYEHDEHPSKEELGQRQTSSRTLAYVRRLEREAGDNESVVSRLRTALADAVAANPPRIGASRGVRAVNIDEAETVALLSDTHYGLTIDRAEVPNSAYNWTLAARRTALFVSQIAAWKPNHRHVSKLRLLLGGDIIEGEIHGPNRSIDHLSMQVVGAWQILTAAIEYLREHYATIEVVCTPGNHGRWPQLHGRAVTEKFDAIDTVFHHGLASTFRSAPEVRFVIPRTPYSEWTAPGGVSCALTHGDTVIHAGSLGRSVNVERLATQVRRWNAARSSPLRVLALGHYHTPIVTELDDGTVLVVNGSLCGTAPYAQSLGVHGSHPVQLLWESVRNHPVGDVRFVRVGAADEDASLDGVIATPRPIGAAA